MSLRERWNRFWGERQACKRAALIAAGRAAVERYTPCARGRQQPGLGSHSVPLAHDPGLDLRTDRDG